MGDIKGFMKITRQPSNYRPVCERIKDYGPVDIMRSQDQSRQQASRCMDCGTPFCHWGCPLGNYIPEWNDSMFKNHLRKAYELLEATNNFPEFTGRVCPAHCEYACVLGVNDDAVTIRENELAIIEEAFHMGIVKPEPPVARTGKTVAVVGSGPAGLACASQLNKAGHTVVVYEKDDKIGGILRYGIPDFKLEKNIIDRRISLMKQEGITFNTSVNVGIDYEAGKLLKKYDTIVLAGGSRKPRDLVIEGRNLGGIHFAMDYLSQSNKRVAGKMIPRNQTIDAKGKKVVIIGGGDTGSDCVGTAHRQGASCVIQLEVLPKFPTCRTEEYPWPKYPLILKTSSSHEEGGELYWSVLTKKFIGKKGQVHELECVKVEFNQTKDNTCPTMKEISQSRFEIEADLVIISVGFIHPEHEGLLTELGVGFDDRGNVKTDENFMTPVSKVFCAGDMHRGQSLVVWAISEGRKAAYYIDKYLMGTSNLAKM